MQQVRISLYTAGSDLFVSSDVFYRRVLLWYKLSGG